MASTIHQSLPRPQHALLKLSGRSHVFIAFHQPGPDGTGYLLAVSSNQSDDTDSKVEEIQAEQEVCT